MAPRQTQSTEHNLPDQTLVLDNGAYSIKGGFVTPEPKLEDCHIIPNAIGKGTDSRNRIVVFVGDQLDSCRDFGSMSFKRPVERGYIVNWESQLDIWKQAIFNDNAKLHCDPRATNLIITESPNCPSNLQTHTDQIIFEECEFASAFRTLPATLNAYNDISSLTSDPPSASLQVECLVVVDIGYSHTTITPTLHGNPIRAAIRRLDVGGKLLSNHLTHLLSLQHYDLSAEPFMTNQIKEDVSFVSQDFNADMEKTWHGSAKSRSKKNDIVLDYVLPNWRTTTRGAVREHDPTVSEAARMAADRLKKERGEIIEQYFPISNERFVVPELLFHPQDIGLEQAGLPETIVQSLSCIPQGLWPGMLANVIVVGGTAKIPGLVERLNSELRAITPAQCMVRVRSSSDPVRWTWLGGARLAGLEGAQNRLKNLCVTREEYNENGAAWVARKFAGANVR